MWTTNVDLMMGVELFELFAGEAKVSQAFREEGISYVSYDCIYDPTGRSMNFLSSGGFAFRAQLVVLHYIPASLSDQYVCMAVFSKAGDGMCDAGDSKFYECFGSTLCKLVLSEPGDFGQVPNQP